MLAVAQKQQKRPAHVKQAFGLANVPESKRSNLRNQ